MESGTFSMSRSTPYSSAYLRSQFRDLRLRFQARPFMNLSVAVVQPGCTATHAASSSLANLMEARIRFSIHSLMRSSSAARLVSA